MWLQASAKCINVNNWSLFSHINIFNILKIYCFEKCSVYTENMHSFDKVKDF